MNILFKLKPEYNAVHTMLDHIYLFDIKSILFFIEETEIENKNFIAAAILYKFYFIAELSPNINVEKICNVYSRYMFNEDSNMHMPIYENIFDEFFEYTPIVNESDLLNDFKPYIKVSKNEKCSYGIETVLYTCEDK
jgi:hypothetical protein